MFTSRGRYTTFLTAGTAAIGVSFFSFFSFATPEVLQARGAIQRPQTIEAGTRVVIRTTQPIDERTADGRVFRGVVAENILDQRNRVAIPRGATAELLVRNAGRNELYLDLESITTGGDSYGIAATGEVVNGGTRVDSKVGANQETAERVGGGALIGSIIGAVIGGGKGAAVGAATGAGVGASTELEVHGQRVHVPAGSIVTFRLEEPLRLGWRDSGRDRDGVHYHDYRDDNHR